MREPVLPGTDADVFTVRTMLSSTQGFGVQVLQRSAAHASGQPQISASGSVFGRFAGVRGSVSGAESSRFNRSFRARPSVHVFAQTAGDVLNQPQNCPTGSPIWLALRGVQAYRTLRPFIG